ncbi:MAG: hypothetical protein ACJ8J0_13650 [Longimicrobiaceae bacterium]
MSVVVSRNGEKARRLERHVLENEAYLQSYIQANPDCIPLHELKEGIQLVVLAREFPTDCGNIDALAVDQDGEVYIIETKLYRNADKRKVIAQVLDYGASLAMTAVDKAGFLDDLDSRVTKAFECTACAKLSDDFGLDEAAAEQFRDAIYEAVAGGRVTFVVLMDQLDERLKNLIKFLNRSSLFNILGVELDFYRVDDIEILIPRLFGGEVRKEVPGAVGTRPRWTEEKFLEDAQRRLDASQFAAVEKLFAWSRQHKAEIAWGSGKARGSFSVRFPVVSTSKSVFSVYSDGTLNVNFGWLVESEAARACAQVLVGCVRSLGLAKVPENYEQKYPTIRIDDWKGKLEEITQCFERAVDAARQVSARGSS